MGVYIHARNSLCFLDFEMMFVELLWAEEPGRDCTLLFPALAVLFEREMVFVRHPHRNVGSWPISIHGAALVEECVDGPAVGDDDDGARADLERKDWPILLGPFLKSAQELQMTPRSPIRVYTYFLASPVVGIRCAFPSTGTVGGPGGRRRSLLPICEILYAANVISASRNAPIYDTSNGMLKSPRSSVREEDIMHHKSEPSLDCS